MKTKSRHVCVVLLCVVACGGISRGYAAQEVLPSQDAPEIKPLQIKEYRIERTVTPEAQACIDCHSKDNPGVVGDWADSRHAHANVTCLDCHRAGPADSDISKAHFEYSDIAITPVVSPKDCSRCHPTEAQQYSLSKHANTLDLIWKIDPWLNDGQNNAIERTTGCYYCHGTTVEVKDGAFSSPTWPNVGVGRINPDGSKGSCTPCHTRHKFSLAEARKPEACDQCHLGPDHPQIEIYNESKHGTIYHAEGDQWTWDSPPGTWTPGLDYRVPTCATCHMSAVGGVATTHDCTERLSWELQAPLTVRPTEFAAFPSKLDWRKERTKMETVCMACHSKVWVKGHFEQLDQTVENYNENYFKPAKKMIDELYEKKLLDKTKNLDEMLEFEMYELWHHEGRRARFGVAMMAPDYAWWHGFYELKKRFMVIQEEFNRRIKRQEAGVIHTVQGSGGHTTPPESTIK